MWLARVSINMDADVLDEAATLPRILSMQEEFLAFDASLIAFEDGRKRPSPMICRA